MVHSSARKGRDCQDVEVRFAACSHYSGADVQSKVRAAAEGAEYQASQGSGWSGCGCEADRGLKCGGHVFHRRSCSHSLVSWSSALVADLAWRNKALESTMHFMIDPGMLPPGRA